MSGDGAALLWWRWELILIISKSVGLPDQNAGCPVVFEFQKNNEEFLFGTSGDPRRMSFLLFLPSI